ncbi:hypothetical protein BV898_11080 [Hypsibius exemplaris]|uniref:Uncharacterized protein n=1 Tax=Hypsibius exemplaris TaxID=2072580 RepID=A0A1W0WHN0_HYPEX|nr:hypothetical protein BV898_11080 [Hypsibius exemplaris]
MQYYYNLMVDSFTGAEGDFGHESERSFESLFSNVVEPLPSHHSSDLAKRIAQRNAEELEALRRHKMSEFEFVL